MDVSIKYPVTAAITNSEFPAGCESAQIRVIRQIFNATTRCAQLIVISIQTAMSVCLKAGTFHFYLNATREGNTMSHHRRRYSKRELLGSLHVDYVMSVTDLGLAAGSNRWDVLRAFLAVGEARAERLVEEEDGVLILQSIPGRPNTGGIYLFAEPLQAFFWLRFDHKEDTLNGDDFQFALRVYHLLDAI